LRNDLQLVREHKLLVNFDKKDGRRRKKRKPKPKGSLFQFESVRLVPTHPEPGFSFSSLCYIFA
jgi:hypothetical protein